MRVTPPPTGVAHPPSRSRRSTPSSTASPGDVRVAVPVLQPQRDQSHRELSLLERDRLRLSTARLGLTLWFSDAREAVAEDRLSLDEQRAGACVARFESGGCSSPGLPFDPWATFLTCPDPFVGKTPIGERCFIRNECVPEGTLYAGSADDRPVRRTSPEGVSHSPWHRQPLRAGRHLSRVRPGGGAMPLRCGTARPGCTAADPSSFAPGRRRLASRASQRPSAGRLRRQRPSRATTPRPRSVCAGNVCSRCRETVSPAFGRVHPPCDTEPRPGALVCWREFNAPGICAATGTPGEACGARGYRLAQPISLAFEGWISTGCLRPATGGGTDLHAGGRLHSRCLLRVDGDTDAHLYPEPPPPRRQRPARCIRTARRPAAADR